MWLARQGVGVQVNCGSIRIDGEATTDAPARSSVTVTVDVTIINRDTLDHEVEVEVTVGGQRIGTTPRQVFPDAASQSFNVSGQFNTGGEGVRDVEANIIFDRVTERPQPEPQPTPTEEEEAQRTEVGAECTSDAECPPGTICIGGQCRIDPSIGIGDGGGGGGGAQLVGPYRPDFTLGR